MEFEIYCDESCPEVLRDKSAHNYLVLGSLWMPAERRDEFKESIKQLKEEFNYTLEIKWNKVSPAFVDFYKALVNYFFETDYLRFRALTVKSANIDLVKFHEGDAELSFYKFYYQLIHHWILDFNDYSIFVDFKINKERTRLHTLREALNNSNLTSLVKFVQSIPSDESLGIQIADFLMGTVNGKFNGNTKSEAKKAIIKIIESKIEHEIKPTAKDEEKFNVFNINLQGGW